MKMNEKLVILRKEKRLSQLKLAETLSVSRQAVSRWEVGEASPSLENMKCISRLYGVSLEDLLDDAVDLQSVIRKNDNKKGPISWDKRLLGGLAIIIVVGLLCIIIFTREGKNENLVGRIPEESVEIAPESVFSLEWDE